MNCCLYRSFCVVGRPCLQHLPIRWNGSKPSEPLEAKQDLKIKEIISALNKVERERMYDQLRVIIYDEKPAKAKVEEPSSRGLLKFLKRGSDSLKRYMDRPTMSQLNKLFLFHSLPYLAFGFMDNAIMIVAGEYIQTTLGLTLSLSPMASAGLGNALADAISIGMAYQVEQFFSSLVKAPSSLKLSHFELKSTRIVIQSARVVGIVIGCLLGLMPLLFIHT